MSASLDCESLLDCWVPAPLACSGDSEKPCVELLLPLLSERALNLLKDGPLLRELGRLRMGSTTLGKGRGADDVRISTIRAGKTVRVLRDFCSVFFPGYEADWERVALHYSILDYMDIMITNLKYHTVYLAGLRRNELPVRKDAVVCTDGFLVDSELRRRILQKIKSKPTSGKTRILVETLLLGLKRGFPSMQLREVDKEIDRFLEDMAKCPPDDAEILTEVERTCKEIVGDEKLDISPAQLSRNYSFSTRAGVGAPIVRGGIQGWLLRQLDLRPETVFLGFREDRSRFSDPQPVYEQIVPYWVTWTTMMKKFSVAKLAESEMLAVEVSAILEPLKVRLITKGDPRYYGLLKPFQATMLESLQRFPCFRLNKEDLTFRYLDKQMSIHPAHGSSRTDWTWFVSGDYVGSTNNITMGLTKRAYESLWASRWHPLLEKTLGPQLIRAGGDRSVTQRVGQLMGSPVSFPILCVINAAIARRAYELADGRKYHLGQLPIAIHGDDFAARMSEKIFGIWKGLVQRVGWSLSPGKSFFSQEFVQINSTTYYVDKNYSVERLGSEACLETTPCPFVNFAYVHLMGKDVTQVDDSPIPDHLSSFRSQYEELSCLPAKLRDRARACMLENVRLLADRVQEAGYFSILEPDPEIARVRIGETEVAHRGCIGIYEKYKEIEVPKLTPVEVWYPGFRARDWIHMPVELGGFDIPKEAVGRLNGWRAEDTEHAMYVSKNCEFPKNKGLSKMDGYLAGESRPRKDGESELPERGAEIRPGSARRKWRGGAAAADFVEACFNPYSPRWTRCDPVGSEFRPLVDTETFEGWASEVADHVLPDTWEQQLEQLDRPDLHTLFGDEEERLLEELEARTREPEVLPSSLYIGFPRPSRVVGVNQATCLLPMRLLFDD